jgi:hypothetical protein
MGLVFYCTSAKNRVFFIAAVVRCLLHAIPAASAVHPCPCSSELGIQKDTSCNKTARPVAPTAVEHAHSLLNQRTEVSTSRTAPCCSAGRDSVPSASPKCLQGTRVYRGKVYRVTLTGVQVPSRAAHSVSGSVPPGWHGLSLESTASARQTSWCTCATVKAERQLCLLSAASSGP